MTRRRAVAWLGAVLAAFWFLGAMGAGQLVDCFQAGDYPWLVAGREMRLDPAAAWDSPWIAYWRPVTKAFFAVATGLFGDEANAYLRLGLLLHLVNGLLIADIALKFRAGPLAAAFGSLFFLVGKHHLVVIDSAAGLSVLFPAFLGLLGLRLGIARGTGAHIAAIFVLAAALWARETYAALPLVVILLLPDEERGWAQLTPRFALSLALLSAGYLFTRWIWQGGVAEVAQAELERALDGSTSGLLTNLWSLLRVATVPPRHVDPDGFWVALLFLLMLLSFSTHIAISRHRILRLLIGAVLVFLPSALLRSNSAETAIAFAEPHHLYGPACFASIAVCLLITLRPTDQRVDGEGYEDTCMRAVGEFLTLALMIGLMVRNADALLDHTAAQRSTAHTTAQRLAELAPWVEASPPGRPLLVVGSRKAEKSTLPGDARALQAFAEWKRPGRGRDLTTVESFGTERLRALDDLEGRQWVSALRTQMQPLAILFWEAPQRAFRGRLPSRGSWTVLAPLVLDAGGAEFRLQGRDVWLDFSAQPAYGTDLSVVHEAVELEADDALRAEPLQDDLVPPIDLLLLLRQ